MARPRSPTPAPARAPAGGVRSDGHATDHASPSGRAECKTCPAKKRRRPARERKRRKRLEERRRRIAGRVKPPVRDRVWAAGHFEGEGTVTLMSGGRKRISLAKVHLSSTDRDVVDFFQATWPGRIDSVNRTYEQWSARTLHRWTLVGHDAIECFLLDIRPHLKTPRVREKVALLLDDIRDRVQLRRTPDDRARKLERMAKMRELNRRGLPPRGEAE